MIEKNILFIHPLSEKLQELLKEVNEDDDFVVFEIDSLAEYGQVVGVLEHSVTFSSDLKKTRSYLEDYSQFVKNKNARNILLQDGGLPPHIFSKLQSLGLNESLKESTPVKSLKHKMGIFFNGFAQKEETSLNQKSVGTVGEKKKESGFMKAKIGESYRENNNSMFNFDQNKRKAKNSYDFTGLSNFKLKKNKTDMSFLNSSFSNMQRKNVSQFAPKLKSLDLKKTNFQPLSGVLKKNPFKESLGIQSVGELKKKSLGKFEEVQRPKGKERKRFEEVPKELRKKEIENSDDTQEVKGRKNSGLILEALNKAKKKRKPFHEEEVLRLKKKPISLEEFDGLVKKRLKFEEVDLERKRKKVSLDEEDLNRKKGAQFEGKDIEKKSLDKFQEVEKEKEKRKRLDLDDIESKKAKNILDLEDEQKLKKKGTFEEVDQLNKKKNRFEEVESDPNVKNKKLNLEEQEAKRKKAREIEAAELERKKKKFEEVELELDKTKKGFQEIVNDLDKKNKKFEEVEKENQRKKDTLFEEAEMKHLSGRIGSFEEVAKKRKENEKRNEPTKEEYELLLSYNKDKKKGVETVLDYKKLYKEYKGGDLKVSNELESKLTRKYCDELAEQEDINVLPFDSYGVEYLVNFNDLLWRSKGDSTMLLKFAHFSLMKEFQGQVAFYQGKAPSFELMYQGLKEDVFGEDFETFEKVQKKGWGEQALPKWKDDTFQLEMNEFVYPFYHEGEHLGFAVAFFPNTVKNHMEAKKVELLLTMVKGVYLENSVL